MNPSYTFMSAPPSNVGKVVDKNNSRKKENIFIGVLVTLSILFVILIVGLLIYRSQLPTRNTNNNPVSSPESFPVSNPVSFVSNLPSYRSQINGLLTNSNLTESAKWDITDILNSDSFDYQSVKCNSGESFDPNNKFQTLALTNASNEQLDSEVSRIKLALNIAGWKQCNSIRGESLTTEVWTKQELLISLKITRATSDLPTSAGIEAVFEYGIL